jgi:hypothetical protein
MTQSYTSHAQPTAEHDEAALERKVEQLRGDIVRQSYAERQLRARSAQRAADSRAEAAAARAEAVAARADAADARCEAAAARADAANARAEASHLERKLRHAFAISSSLPSNSLSSWIRHRLVEWRNARIVRNSQLFDPVWYIQRYSTVATQEFDPAYDFLRTGVWMDRDPGPGFDASWYLSQYPDVVGINPLLHYILFGASEGREIRAVEK